MIKTIYYHMKKTYSLIQFQNFIIITVLVHQNGQHVKMNHKYGLMNKMILSKNCSIC